MGNNTRKLQTQPSTHPQHGRRYGQADLQRLADQGDAWALCRLDEWDQKYADAYSAAMTDSCPDESCVGYGEPVTICHAADGSILDVDHGGWGHYLAEVQAKAS